MKTIKEFLQDFTIDINKHIRPYFELQKQLDITGSKSKCANCNDANNIYSLRSEPWTSVLNCVKCKSLIVIVWSDRMSGAITDTVMIYKEKK